MATKKVQLAFEPKGVVLPIDKIVPLRPGGSAGGKSGPIAQRIAASIREVGVIEPFVVFRRPGRKEEYLLLEGNVRLSILKQLGKAEVFCLLATEDEAYTYNHKVNHLSPIQEHFMILRAIESGVAEERIAAALAVNVGSIRQKRDLLRGLAPEAVTLLKDKRATAGALRELKKVKAMAQIEMVEMMISVNNFSAEYARCLLAATRPEQFVDGEKSKAIPNLTPDQVARVERELAAVCKDFRRREESYGKATIDLVFAGAYLRKLLDSAPVVRFLSQRHAEILAEFQRISETTDLEAV